MVDLLDLGGWDDTTPAAPAAQPPAHDTFTPTPHNDLVVVETVSDDGDDNEVVAAAPAAPVEDVDPFASAGLLGDSDQPLPSLPQQQTPQFAYQGQPLTPWTITTPEFGQHWTALASAPSPSVSLTGAATIQDFVTRVEKAGVHVVQIIGVEAICAAQLGGGSLQVLLHAKAAAAASKVDVTVKCTDPAAATALALYLQNLA